MIQYANDRGIMMGLCIGGFPANSSWWTLFNTQARDDRWFRYVVARYAALNVRWVLYGEVNEANPPWGTWQSEVAHKAALVKSEDPYRHPIGSHHTTVDKASIADPNIGYLEVLSPTPRSETQFVEALGYRLHGKPVWFEEYWYEPAAYDNEYVLGIRNTHRNFIAALAFPTFGSLMRAGRDARVRKALEEAVARWRPPSSIAETGAGDAVLVADDDPVALAQMARHLMDEVYLAPGQPRLRIARLALRDLAEHALRVVG